MRNELNKMPSYFWHIVLTTVFIFNAFAFYFNLDIIAKCTPLLLVIIFMAVFYHRMHKMATIFITSILMLFIGDVLSTLELGENVHKFAQAFYLGSYSLLIFVLIGKLKWVKIEGVVSGYLLLVFILGVYFINVLYGTLNANYINQGSSMLYGMHAIALIGMLFFAFAAYLCEESMQAIRFLTLVFCFVFSDVIQYICNFYLYFWVFEFIQLTFHLMALALLFQYVYTHHKYENEISPVNKESYKLTDNKQQISA